jgi:transcriptional regulator with XRE-family HTH domain
VTSQDMIGQRIKTIRRQRGFSQAQLAHPELSDSYVSLIESGKRTPTPAVLELLAQKLDCSLTYLVNGVTAEEMEELEVGLRFAKIALDNGDVEEARRRYSELLSEKSLAGLPALRQQADFGFALAVEACGDLTEAITILNRLLEAEDLPSDRRVSVAMALCRCYRDNGDLGLAVEVGERMLGGATPPDWNDDLVELGATLLSVYRVRGDLLRARHFASELLAVAESLGSPRAIVAACWNSANLASETGRGEDGMALIERAMAIQSENGEPRNLARLRVAYASLMMTVRPEDAETARDLLLRAQRELSESSTSTLDRARCHLELARAEMLLRRPETAVEQARLGRDILSDSPREHRGYAQLVLGQALLMVGREDDAAAELIVAGEQLDTTPTHKAAQNWMTAAEAFLQLGKHDRSTKAYQKALACAGL